jgi:hypothetical protein
MDVEPKSDLEGPTRELLLALEQLEHLGQDLVKRHGCPPSRPWLVMGLADPRVASHPRYTACSAEKEVPCLTPAYYRDSREIPARLSDHVKPFQVN